ncbi:MAG: hypothetical protein ACUVX1_07165 [Chloroflexota bacterium]
MTDQKTPKGELNKRLESISWGLFLVMIGGIWLVPDARVPDGTWLVGVGLIMLGLNVARYLNHIAISGFTAFLGAVALMIGLGDLAGIDLPLFPIILIILGLYLLFKVLVRQTAEVEGMVPANK